MRRIVSSAGRAAAPVFGFCLLAAGQVVGCSTEPPTSPMISEGVGEAQEAWGAAPVCVSIRRQGASGSVADAQIANKLPARSYGLSETMNTGPVGAGGEERRTLLQFDLSAIPTFPNVTTNVVSATVTLAPGHLAPTGPGTIQVHRVTAPWSESTVTWQSLPTGYYDPAIEASFGNAGTALSFGLETLVGAWANGDVPNHGVVLEDPGTNATNFWSSEHATVSARPELTVCYSQSCKAGYADCNGDSSDGCETPIDTATDCGACGVACASGVCASGACAAPACNDGVQNGSETAVDCGGSCSPCAAGLGCQAGSDCQSAVCSNGTCAAPTCNDGVQNGSETAIDCGGSCAACTNGQTCQSGADCVSGMCSGGTCAQGFVYRYAVYGGQCGSGGPQIAPPHMGSLAPHNCAFYCGTNWRWYYTCQKVYVDANGNYLNPGQWENVDDGPTTCGYAYGSPGTCNP
jgi:hypothetical protein